MNVFEFVWYYLIPFLFVLTVLVYVHEWGHYWVARRNNVRVEVFSIGFGPEIFGWNNKAGTRWKIGAIPFGGYIKMFGENDVFAEGEDRRPLSPEESAVSFHTKTLLQRSAIVAAGPIANFLLAIVLFAALVMTQGVPRHYAAVGEILPKSAAAEAGFKVGDRIVSIDGEKVVWFTDLVRVVSSKPGAALNFGIVRDGSELILVATPKKAQRTNDEGKVVEFGLLGVRFDPKQAKYERQNPLAATWTGVEQTVLLTGNILNYLGQIIVGKQTAEDLGGPLRIAKMSGQMAQGGFDNLIFFMAALSVNLGMINLFPIPLLDGGHLLFYAAEALRGRPLGPRAQEYGFRFGLILVLILMVFATWNDLVHLRVIEFIKELVT
ncbi:MAG: RIP metalloprotease RseP [Rhodospirillales bacterium RIFCSPLOWO2_01_FULL_65_14]|nr:MAG: RIP metalloprotease RseP [Rhodospirillales bacterium RIFCSPLOWO2_01_FULL_65_14]